MAAGFLARRALLILILSFMGAFGIGYGLYLHVGEVVSIIGFFVFLIIYYAALESSRHLVALLNS